MKFVNKVLDFLKGLVPTKPDKTTNEKDSSDLLEGEEGKGSAFKTFTLKVVKFIYKYLKKFVIFILGLILTMSQPMIKIAKKHPIAFWAAVIFHVVLLTGLFYADVGETIQKKSHTSQSMPQSAPIEAIVIDIEIIEAEKERIEELEKQKLEKLKEQEKRSESAKASQKIAEQEALKAKAKKVMAEIQREAEEAKTKEAEILAQEAAKQKEEAEVKRKAEEVKAKQAEEKRKTEEAKTKEAEKQKDIAEELALKAQIRLEDAERKTVEAKAKAQEAEVQAMEATKTKELAEARSLEAESKALEAEQLALEAVKQKGVIEAKAKVAEESAQKAAKLKEEAEAKAKEAEAKAQEAEEQKNIAAAERAAEKEAFEKEQYNRLLTQEVQAEQDIARGIIIEDQLNTLKTAYVNNIAARIKSYWNYQGAEDDWGCDVYVLQDSEGNVKAVNIQKCNLDDSTKAKSFKDSIERATYKAQPLPMAPDDAVFDAEILFYFRVN